MNADVVCIPIGGLLFGGSFRKVQLIQLHGEKEKRSEFIILSFNQKHVPFNMSILNNNNYT